MLAAIKDYKEWRSYKVPVAQALRLTWKSKVAILLK
jgi:hypothetical protein